MFELNILLVLAKTETTYGVDAVPLTTVNAIQPVKCELSPEIVEIAKDRYAAKPRSVGAQIGPIAWGIKLEFDMSGPPDPGMSALPEPSWAKFAKACGMKVTSSGVPVDTHAYTFDARNTQNSLTIHVYAFEHGSNNAVRYRLTGCRFKPYIKGGMGEATRIYFEGMGLYQEDPDDETPTIATIVYDASEHELGDGANGKAMSMDLNGVEAEVTKFEWKCNREVMARDSVTASQGHKEFFVQAKPDSQHEINIDPLLESIATRDAFALLLAETKVSWLIQGDTSGGTRWKLNGSRIQEASFKFENNNGVFRLPGKFIPCDSDSGGDSAVTLTISRTP